MVGISGHWKCELGRQQHVRYLRGPGSYKVSQITPCSWQLTLPGGMVRLETVIAWGFSISLSQPREHSIQYVKMNDSGD